MGAAGGSLRRFALIVTLGLAVPTSALAQSFTITRTSSPIFYLDAGEALQGMYVSYKITNTSATPAPDVWVQVASFTGGVVLPAANEDSLVHLGAIGAGETKTAFFYLQATGATATPQSHTVSVYGTRPPAAALASTSFSMTAESTIQANANKVTTTVVGPNPPTLGGIVTITVTGETGTIGQDTVLSFTPATYLTWRADAYEMIGSEITLTVGNSGVFTDELLIPPVSITSSANTFYTAVYTFRAVGTTSAPTAVSPVGYISSGAQVKHTSTTNFGTLLPIQPADNRVRLVKQASPATLSGSDTVTYTVPLTNTSATDSSSVDDFVDVLPTAPAAVSYVPGSSQYNGSPIPNPSISGATLTWIGTFSVPAGATRNLVFRAVVPAAQGTYTNRAVAHVSAEQIDTTLSTTDDAPGTADVVVGSADVAVAKTGPASVPAGDTITYVITTTNGGASAATQVVVRDTLPAGVAFVSATRGASESGGVVTWPAVASLANGASVVDTVRVLAPATGTLVNVARVTSTIQDPDTLDNRSTVSTTVNERADLTAAKTGPASVGAGDTVTYVLTTTNTGPSAAASVVVTDSLPAGVTFVSATRSGVETGGVVTWPAVATLANGASVVDTVKVLAPATGTLANVGRATSTTVDPDTLDNRGTVSTTVTERADLAVTKAGPASVVALDTITYVVTTVNTGPSAAASVVVTDSLPAGVTFVSATRSGVEAGGVVTWPAVATLANGASVVDTVRVVAPATGTLSNVARATSTTLDPDSLDDRGTVSTTVAERADLSVTKTGPASIPAGDTITYVITTTNTGPSAAASVVAQDTLPAAVTFVSATRGATESGGVVTWPALASLANGASLVDTVRVVAPETGTLTNVARATTTTVDPDPADDRGTTTTTIAERADLAVTKTGPASVVALDTITYVITTANTGPSAAASVVVTDSLPAGVTFVSVTRGAVYSGGVVTWPTVATLANGAALTDTVRVIAPATGTLTNVARASAPTVDPDLADNRSTTTTTVAEQADLAVTKAGPASVVALDTITYVISTTNTGPSAAASVVVQDTLPATVTFVAATRGATESAGVVTWPAVATLPNAGALIDTVRVVAPATGTLVNVARATATTVDPDPLDDRGTATTTVAERADLAVTKTGPASVVALDTITYVITTANGGPSTAAAVLVSDSLPVSVTFVSATRGGTSSGGVVTWPAVATLGSGASLVDTVRVVAPATGTLVNVARATTTTVDPDPLDDRGTATTTVAERADLAVTKAGPASVTALDTIIYVITTTNTGPSAAASVVVLDTLPAGVTFVSATRGAVESGGAVTWPAIATLANGASLVDTVRGVAPAAGTLTNVARATTTTVDPDALDDRSTVTTTVTERADLALTKAGPAAVAAGDTITYVISTVNGGPSAAAAVLVTDSLPAGVTFLSASRGAGESGGVVSWPVVPTLASGASLVDTVRVRAPASGTLVNVARATSTTADPDALDNRGTVTTTVGELADLSVTKTGPASVVAADTITYVVTTANTGPSAAAQVVVTDSLPAGAAFLSATRGGSESGGVVTWPVVATLANGVSLVDTVRVRAPATGTLVNVARATSTTADPDALDNRGTVSTTVQELADLQVSKSGPASVAALDTITYVVTTTNGGPSSAQQVAVTDSLPAGVTFVSATRGAGQSGGVVTWPLVATLANGASLVDTVRVVAPATGTLANVARAASTTTDPNSADNRSTVTTGVQELADVRVTKTGPAAVLVGDTITYVLTTANAGPSDAQLVVVRDTLPAGVTFVSATRGAGESAGVVTWPAVASLADGSSVVDTVRIVAPAAGTLVNVAAAGASTTDPSGADNRSTVTTSVGQLADVAVVKSGPASVTAGDTITYVIVTTNTGPSAAQQVVTSDTLPGSVTFLSATRGATLSAGVVRWPAVASLADGASVTDTVRVLAPGAGPLLNIVAAAATTSDPDLANNNGSAGSSRVTTTVTPLADVAVTKTGPAAVSAGDTIVYLITARNNGPSAAQQVVVSDALPVGVTFLSATRGGVESGGTVTWPAIAALASGASAVDTLRARAPAAGTLLNVASGATTTPDALASNNDGSAPAARVTTTVTELADVEVVLTGPAAVPPADTVTYVMTVTNRGPSGAAAVVLRYLLPAGVTYLSSSRGASESGGTVTWPAVATLAESASFTDTVIVLAPLAGSVEHVATVAATTTDPNGANNVSRRTTGTLAPDLALTKAAVGTFEVGDSGSYAFTVANVGTAATIGPITLADTLPAGLTYVDFAGAGWSCSASGQAVGCTTAGPVAPTATSVVTLTVSIGAAAVPAVTNRAVVATAGDANAANDTSSATTAINSASALFIEKVPSRDDVAIGDVVDYTVRVRNVGDDPVTDVEVEDGLPAGFTYQPGTARLDGAPLGDPAGSPGPRLVFPVGVIPVGGTATVTYRVAVGAGARLGDGVNTAVARSPNTGSVSNTARAKVMLRDDVFSDEGIIAGRVFLQTLGGDGPGVPGVRVYLEDGTTAVTDSEGKYHFTGIRPRLHVVRVDEATLPQGAELVTLANRHAWDARSLFVDLKKGEFHRADFAIAAEPATVPPAVAARREQGDPGAAIPGVPPRLPDGAPPVLAERTQDATYAPLLPDSTLTERNSALRVVRPRAPEGPDTAGGAALRLWVPQAPLPADGRTHVPVRVQLVGAGAAPERATVTLESNVGRWDVADDDDRLPGVQTTLAGGAGEFLLVAPERADTGRVRATSGALSDQARITFTPARHPLTFSGVLDGRLEFRSLGLSELGAATKRDRFEDELTALALDGDDGTVHAEGRAAFMLQGDVGRDYLLTVRLDTEADDNARLFRDIRPDELYPIYGDASIQAFDARSTSRFYARLDRGRSSVLYGDFLTPPASAERQLGAYYRSLTGALGHVETDHLNVNAWASRGDDGQIVDEIAAQGISGPYELSRSDGLINSERVEILTRDRNQPAVILKIEPQTRFADYTLQPLTGQLVFRQPVPSLDGNLNPVSIRITYAVAQGGDDFWVYGVDAQGRAGDRVELGGSLVRDDNPAGSQAVYSANTTLRLRDDLFVVGEYAWSDSAGVRDGDGVRFELRHVAPRLQARAFFVETDTGFANPSSALARGRRELGLRADGVLNERTRLFGELVRTEDLVGGGMRWGLQAAAARRLGEWLDFEAGYRHSEESAAPATPATTGATPFTTNTLRARLSGRLPRWQRVSAFGEWEQDLGHLDRHRGTLGGDYRFGERARLYAQHELLSSLAGPYALNSAQTQSNTVIGLESRYLENTQVFSEYRLRDALTGREAQAAIGVRSRWTLGPGLRLDGSLERVAPLAGSGVDAFAVTGGLEYTAHPDRKGTARLEYRTSGADPQWFGSVGWAQRVSEDVAVLARSAVSWMGDARLYERTQLGLAFRQDERRRWNALARYEHTYDRDERTPGMERTQRAHALSGHVNYRATAPLVLSGQLASRWAADESQGLASSSDAYLLGLRATYDINRRFDGAINLRGLASGGFDSRQYGVGAELGYILIRNLRVAAGYNVFGFRDADMSDAGYTDHGLYLAAGYKFDEYTFGLQPRDADRDGVVDGRDRCPETPLGEAVDAAGCPRPRDGDADGVVDPLDFCQGTPAGQPVDARGCPKDGDGDGVVDLVDACPATPAGEVVDGRGCTLPRDPDADGVVDPGDECPDTPAGQAVNERGCAALFAAGVTTLTLEGVNFEFDRWNLTAESSPILDRVAELLLANPEVRVEVAGHTDIRGAHAYNLRLSLARANSVRQYLIGKGVAVERLEARGYGPDQPVDSNATDAGRAKNRRVELRRLE